MEHQIQQLRSYVAANPHDPALKQQLHALKIEIFRNLAQNQLAYQQISLQFCELEVYYTLLNKAIPEFELAIERLVNLYNSGLGSADQFHYIGIFLIYLLSFNKFPQFYSQIELLPREAFQNQFVNFVLDLEYKLSIGSYDDLLGGYRPTGVENVFLERIMDTIRLQTALSANASYASLTIENALKLLHINSIQELRQYAASQNFSWRVDSTHVYFENKQVQANPLNADFLIKSQLKYVHEFDKIV